jgi:hypothetical protein
MQEKKNTKGKKKTASRRNLHTPLRNTVQTKNLPEKKRNSTYVTKTPKYQTQLKERQWQTSTFQ